MWTMWILGACNLLAGNPITAGVCFGAACVMAAVDLLDTLAEIDGDE